MTLQMGIPICPITHDVMREPVIDHEGNSYEKSAILEWLKVNSTSPVSRNPLFAEQLIPNRALLEYYNSREVSTTPIQGTITNCSNCHKVMKVQTIKDIKNYCVILAVTGRVKRAHSLINAHKMRVKYVK